MFPKKSMISPFTIRTRESKSSGDEEAPCRSWAHRETLAAFSVCGPPMSASNSPVEVLRRLPAPLRVPSPRRRLPFYTRGCDEAGIPARIAFVEFVAFFAGHEFHELTRIKFSTVSETVKGRMNRLVLLIATLVNKTR